MFSFSFQAEASPFLIVILLIYCEDAKAHWTKKGAKMNHVISNDDNKCGDSKYGLNLKTFIEETIEKKSEILRTMDELKVSN